MAREIRYAQTKLTYHTSPDEIIIDQWAETDSESSLITDFVVVMRREVPILFCFSHILRTWREDERGTYLLRRFVHNAVVDFEKAKDHLSDSIRASNVRKDSS